MTDETKESVLIVDDEQAFRDLLSWNLTDAGMVTESCETGAEALTRAVDMHPAVVLLDLMLPDMSGNEVCRRLRTAEETSDIGIMMLTARGEEYDRIVGFEVGADDYVVKPFSVREVVLRVRALARRTFERRAARASRLPSRLLSHGAIAVDPIHHHAFIDGSEVNLRPLEFKLLALFLEHPGKMFSRAELLKEIWGVSGDISTRTVDVHIRRLRSRLGESQNEIETVPGFGYRLRVRDGGGA
jgi:two-component system, OmpR family, phosphate regulon response regulator PhoB